jgi:hypothetical protein
LLQDGDIGIGVFPEGEEIFVGGERTDAEGTMRAIDQLSAAEIADLITLGFYSIRKLAAVVDV